MVTQQLLADDLQHGIPPLLTGASVIALVPATELRGWAAEMAWSVARAAAATGRRTVLVDCFVAAPTLHAVAGDGNNEGIVDAFEYGASLNRIVQQQPQADLFFIPAGTYSSDAEPLMQHPRWKRLSAGFRHEEALLLLYVDAEHLPSLAAEPDGVIALAPQGLELAAAEAPALAVAVGRGLPLLAVVAETQTQSQSKSQETQPAETGATESALEPVTATAGTGSGTAPRRASRPMSLLLEEPKSGAPWIWIVLAVMLVGGLAVGGWWWMKDGRQTGTAGAPPAVSPQPSSSNPQPPTLSPSAVESLPFAVQVASLPRLTEAFALADSLSAAGVPSIISPIRLRDRPPLFRVTAGPYASRARADSALATLRGFNVLAPGAGSVVEVPLSLPLASGLTRDAASAERARLRDAGVPAFILGQADGTFRILAGAYGAGVTPLMLQDLLTPTGSAGDLVPRSGYVP